ncbi:MAG: hypothetical protein WBE50_14530, partial [Methyloceanibacter sp.]
MPTADRDSNAAITNEIKSFERLILFRQCGALGDFTELTGKQEPRDLGIVEADEHTAQQLAISLRQAKRQAVLHKPIELVGVDTNDHQVPSDPGVQISA